MSWITTAAKISLLATISFSADTAAVDQEPIYLDVEMQNRCGFALTLADTIDGVSCSGDRQLTDAYRAMSIGYFVNQFEHNDFARQISLVITNHPLEKLVGSGAKGILKRDEDTGEAISGEELHLTEQLVKDLCAKSMRQVQVEKIAANNWRGYLWRRSSRLKKSDLVRDCPNDAIDKECFLLIIGNTTVTLYSDLICLPRNGKKTDPAEFDVGDFMKMIYSITFDSQ
ncbi:hypothetical protein [Herbaspirillum sp. GW103]|uniref:hypothetical protein n=1 Tax=Herbaspirillum sp. GW103 TaxID=1175306 RepID=UPI0005504C19|nr:hypothetical protein [Herbaspirillum sp. GW103]